VPDGAPRIAAIVLAAGASRRMGANKLLATIDGKPLVRLAAEAAVGSRAAPVIVVTGHQAAEVAAAVAALPIVTVFNPEHDSGLAGSLAAGVRRLPADCDGAIVLLGDMPRVDAAIVDRLIAAFTPGRIVVPTVHGRRGNPVLWPRAYFAQLQGLAGDVGGRGLIEANAAAVIEVPFAAAVDFDVDTPDALAAAGGTLR
jgi:molybdenum cofactor cytidylyltransferase